MIIDSYTFPQPSFQKIKYQQKIVLFNREVYQVGSVTVDDSTNRIAQVLPDKTENSLSKEGEKFYKIIVNGKYIVHPLSVTDPLNGIASHGTTCPPEKYAFHFKDPQKITLFLDGDFIRVHEENDKGLTTRFIDLTLLIQGMFHPIFYHKPALDPVTYESKSKAAQLQNKNPDLTLYDLVYNRHGCAAWGLNKRTSTHCFFKALTNHEDLIEDINAIKSITRKTQEFLSSDRKIHYLYFSIMTDQIYLNGEPAHSLHFYSSPFFRQTPIKE